jgi:hypothetical protein
VALKSRFFHPSCCTPQQSDLVVVLQRLDVPGHGRLADEQAGSGFGEAAFTGNGVERTKLKQVHGYRPDL